MIGFLRGPERWRKIPGLMFSHRWKATPEMMGIAALYTKVDNY